MSQETAEQLLVNNFRAYVTPIILVTGIPGNMLVVISFALQQRRQSCRFNLYAIWIALAHILDLVFNALLDDFIGRGLTWLSGRTIIVKLDAQSVFACRLLSYLPPVFSLAAVWLLIIFTVDRVLTLYYPLRYRGDRHQHVTWLGILIVYVVAWSLFAPHLTANELREGYDGVHKYTCQLTGEATGKKIYLIYLAIVGTYITPTIVILVLNTLIIIKFRQLRREQASLISPHERSASLEMRRIYGHLGMSVCFLFITFPLVVVMLMRQHSDLHGYSLLYPAYHYRMVNYTRFFSSFKALRYVADFWIYYLFMPNFRRTIRSLCFLPDCPTRCGLPTDICVIGQNAAAHADGNTSLAKMTQQHNTSLSQLKSTSPVKATKTKETPTPTPDTTNTTTKNNQTMTQCSMTLPAKLKDNATYPVLPSNGPDNRETPAGVTSGGGEKLANTAMSFVDSLDVNSANSMNLPETTSQLTQL